MSFFCTNSTGRHCLDQPDANMRFVRCGRCNVWFRIFRVKNQAAASIIFRDGAYAEWQAEAAEKLGKVARPIGKKDGAA